LLVALTGIEPYAGRADRHWRVLTASFC
jgi:hypothetical protein